MRLGFSVAAILVIQLNPERATRFPILSQAALDSFFVYSLLIFYLTVKETPPIWKLGLLTTGLDLIWVSMMVFFTGSAQTPFFFYYLFPVITASSRYGTRGGLLVALIGVVLYAFIRFSPGERPLRVDNLIIRTIYLFVLAYIFGFLSEFEKKQNQRLMALYKTAGEAAKQEERKRIAHDLHDRLLQVLASVTLRLEACRKYLVESPSELARELELMEQASRKSMAEIREFLAGKDIRRWVSGTLVEKLREEMAFLRDGLNLNVVLETSPEDLNLLPEVEQEIYYVFREGLMNIARHSHASNAAISLKVTERDIQGSVHDDGVGFDMARMGEGNGYGLNAMKDRIGNLGGEVAVESVPGTGTTVSFRLPSKPEAKIGQTTPD